MREIDVTSYAEIVLARAGRRPRASGVRQAVPRDRIPARERRRCSATGGRAIRASPAIVGGARPQPRRPAAGRRSSGKPIARASSAAAATPIDPLALDGRALSGTTGVVLDPILSLRQRVRLRAGRLGAAVVSPPASRPIARPRWRWRRSIATRAPPRAPSRSPSRTRRAALRHLGISSDDALLFERLASRVLYADGSLRADAGRASRRTSSGRPASGRTASPAICRSCSCASSATTTLAARAAGAAGAGVLAAQGPQRRRRDPQRASGRATSTRCTRSSTALLDNGPWRTWKHRPGGAYLLRGDRIGRAERDAARRRSRARSSSGDRGDLRAQLDRPPSGADAAAAAGVRRRRRRRRPVAAEPPVAGRRR